MEYEPQRLAVIEEAKTWLGTPFINCADIKGGGVDCAMLLIRVYSAVGIIEPFDPRPYPSQWHFHHDEERFLNIIRKLGKEVEREPLPGDVMMFKFGRCFSHGTIIIDKDYLIHAWCFEEKVCISSRRDIKLTQQNDGRLRPTKLFDPWAKDVIPIR